MWDDCTSRVNKAFWKIAGLLLGQTWRGYCRLYSQKVWDASLANGRWGSHPRNQKKKHVVLLSSHRCWGGRRKTGSFGAIAIANFFFFPIVSLASCRWSLSSRRLDDNLNQSLHQGKRGRVLWNKGFRSQLRGRPPPFVFRERFRTHVLPRGYWI